MVTLRPESPSNEEKVERDASPPARIHDIEKVDTTWDSSAEIPADLDRRITRKLDVRLMPWLFGLWLLAFIDRSNIGNARIDGLAEDLHLDANKFNIALAVFYVPYICYDVPSNLVIKYFRAGYYLPVLLIAWGIVSLCTGFVKTYSGLLVARFFLGLTEGGLLGGMIVYLAMFYRRHQMLYRITLFYCAAPLSGAFGGLLATGLAQIRSGGYNGWPFIFFVEGAITVVFGILVLFMLPHTPSDIKFMTPEEKHACIARMRLDAHGSNASATVGDEKFSWYWVRRALANVNTIVLSLNFFAIITPIYSFSLFLPTIIRSLGYTAVKAQLLTVPPNMGAFFAVLLVGNFSDKLRVRGPLMLGGCLMAIVGYIMLIASTRTLTQYGGTFFVAAGIFPCSPLVMGWLSNNLAPHYVRATGTGFQIMIANMAAFIATFTYLQEDAPRYTTGHAINIGMLGLALILTSINIVYCRWENQKRASGERDYRLREEDEAMLGYRHPHFKYTI
ncbi:MFS general substrate transporter [Polyplosphaeria fusca]|uniref:MFS general substrate transporter n=1 Tax=Polyplosphaeria fusca TaxID=682080 RepID=A0A9P4R5N9_9PLEO|nr:MFS general substrate transporter [Polyplosphaeria fusca]